MSELLYDALVVFAEAIATIDGPLLLIEMLADLLAASNRATVCMVRLSTWLLADEGCFGSIIDILCCGVPTRLQSCVKRVWGVRI